MIKSELRKLISSTKEEIVKIITAKYLADNEGLFPNWEEEEEIVVDDTDIPTFRISIEVDNTYDESTCIERQAINEYRDGFCYRSTHSVPKEKLKELRATTKALGEKS